MKVTNLINFKILMGHHMGHLYCPMGRSTVLLDNTLRTGVKIQTAFIVLFRVAFISNLRNISVDSSTKIAPSIVLLLLDFRFFFLNRRDADIT